MKKFKKKLTAVIFGISGQDGSYLASFLLKKKYRVIGVTRKINKKKFFRFKLLNIEKKTKLIEGNAVNFNFIKELIRNNKNIKEIYYLSGKSSVIKSFSNPTESFKSNALSIFNILENVKNENNNIKVFYAASGQFFGNNKKAFYDEKSKILQGVSLDFWTNFAWSFLTPFWTKTCIYCAIFGHHFGLVSDWTVGRRIGPLKWQIVLGILGKMLIIQFL